MSAFRFFSQFPARVSLTRAAALLTALCLALPGHIALAQSEPKTPPSKSDGTAAGTEDIVYLDTGRWVKGTIIRETDDEVEIDGTMDGIKTKHTFKRNQILSITRGERPKEDPSKKAPANESKPAPKEEDFLPATTTPDDEEDKEDTKESGPVKADFLRIPLKGTFGQEILPKGVRDCIAFAKKNKINHIVFEIESDGGQVWAAQEIMKDINEAPAEFTFTMVIRRAISASVWPTFACDTIYMLPGSSFGGALAFKIDAAGNADVDNKLINIWAAELANIADTHGHHPQIVRAMTLPNERLYASLRKSDSTWQFSADRPIEERSFYEIRELSDGKKGVVTLTKSQAVEFNIVKPLEDADDESFAKALGDESFKSAGNKGQAMMDKVARDRAKLDSALQGIAKQWKDHVEDAEEDGLTKREAEAMVSKLKSLLGRFGKLREDARKLGVLQLYPQLESDIKTMNEELEKLRRKIRDS